MVIISNTPAESSSIKTNWFMKVAATDIDAELYSLDKSLLEPIIINIILQKTNG